MALLFCRDQHGQPQTGQDQQQPVGADGPAILEAREDVGGYPACMCGVVDAQSELQAAVSDQIAQVSKAGNVWPHRSAWA